MRVWRLMRWSLEGEMESLEGDEMKSLKGDEVQSSDNIHKDNFEGEVVEGLVEKMDHFGDEVEGFEMREGRHHWKGICNLGTCLQSNNHWSAEDASASMA